MFQEYQYASNHGYNHLGHHRALKAKQSLNALRLGVEVAYQRACFVNTKLKDNYSTKKLVFEGGYNSLLANATFRFMKSHI